MKSTKSICNLLFGLLTIILLQVTFIFGMFVEPAVGQDTAELKWVTGYPDMTRLREIACSDKGTYVVVGNDGLIRTSKDLEKWVEQDSGTSETLFGCAWGNGKFVAVGTSGCIIYSENGTEWKPAEFSSTASLHGIVFGNGKFVAVGTYYDSEPGYSRRVVTSIDGINWTVVKEDNGEPLDNIAYLNKHYIAYGFRVLEISSDGVNWTAIKLKADDSFSHIAWDGSRYIAVERSAIWTSADGSDWVPVQHNIGKGLFIDNLVYFKDVYYATVSYDDKLYLISSPDLQHWKLSRSNGFRQICNLIADKDRLVGVGWDDSVIVSNDGVNWQEQKGISTLFHKVVWGDSTFLAIGNDDVVIRSDDGLNWNPVRTNISQELADVIWTGKEFVALACTYNYAPETFDKADSYLYLSSDGINWALFGSIEQVKAKHLFYFNNTLFAIGPLGQILSSADGQNWKISSSGTTEELTSMAWNGRKYVCLGTNGIVLSSSDGTNWTKSQITKGSNLNQVVWNGSMFVAVGDDKNIIRSSDGSTWTASPFREDYYDFVDTLWDGQRFIFLHRQGEVLTTSDFQNIITLSSRSNHYQPLSMTWNGERYVMVGRWGSIAACLPTDLVKIKINGVPIPLDVAPKIFKGRTMIPVRAVMEKLGAAVRWDAESKTVEVTKDGVNISLSINQQTAIVNGEEVPLDSAATIVDGRTLIPVRFVSESLGATVFWEENTKTVVIEKANEFKG